MRFGILGAVEVRRGGDVLPVGGPLVRALLAILLLDAGRLVPTERLIDGLYGEDPPSGAANALSRRCRGCAGALGTRRWSRPARRVPAQCRARRCRRAPVRAARRGGARAGDAAAELFEEALGLWRGAALADVRAPFAAAQAARLEEERAAAVEGLGEARIRSGDPESVVAPLRDLVDAQPLRERARALLMRALHASGRQAEALSVFEDGRRVLADELGADPSKSSPTCT